MQGLMTSGLFTFHSKGKWLKVSSYVKSQLPTVMKKIVKVALLNQE